MAKDVVYTPAEREILEKDFAEFVKEDSNRSPSWCFAGLIPQEHYDSFHKKAIELGVSESHIKAYSAGCKYFFQLGIYIKFYDVDAYTDFVRWSMDYLTERW